MDWVLIETINGDGLNATYHLSNMNMTRVYTVISEEFDDIQQKECNILNLINVHVSVRDCLYLVTDITVERPSNSMELLKKRIADIIDKKSYMIITKSLCGAQ